MIQSGLRGALTPRTVFEINPLISMPIAAFEKSSCHTVVRGFWATPPRAALSGLACGISAAKRFLQQPMSE